MGYHNSGNQLLYNGFTGEQIYSEIFIGPTYYMRLKHMVKDKINYRATGKRNFLTRQTNQGRANDGGLKIGEMERDGIMAHGLSYFLNESYMVRGDQYFMGVCNKTGAIAIYNPETNLFLSPFADGPLVFNKNIEGQEVLNAISKFGRSFSIVRIPFALKLLIQELQVMNIQMRIITEDNIDQLLNLSYQSRNIDKLLYIDHGEDGTVERDIKDIIDDYKKTIEQLTKAPTDKIMTKYQMNETISPREIEYTPEQESVLNQSSSVSPQYAPDSPAYYDYNVDELLENNSSDESLQTQTWSPPFDIPDKNDIFYALPKYVQDNIMRTVRKEMWWNAVNDVNKQIVKNKTGFSVNTPEGSPELRGGGVSNVENIFNEQNMNEAFSKLDRALQVQILELPQEQQYRVMNEIMRKSHETEQSRDPFDRAFKALPLDKQVVALQEGYNSMAEEFDGLSKKIPDAFVTINKPIQISEELEKKLPLISVKQKEENTTSSESLDNNLNATSDTSSFNNSSSDVSNEETTKIIKI